MEELPPLPDDIVETLNARRGGFNQTMGLTFTAASYDEVRAEVPVHEGLHQPYGLVHGGVYSAIAETLASVGAGIISLARGRSVVGLENHTTFLRAVREGTLRARATPLTRGRRSQVWEVAIEGDDGALAATARVRVLCLESGAAVAGKEVKSELPTTG